MEAPGIIPPHNNDGPRPIGRNQTPIWVDSRGRRRTGDGSAEKFPANQDDPVKAAAAEIAALRAELAGYKGTNDSRSITGPGFSGTLGSGISWNPFGAGAVGPASEDSGGDNGTAVNPYVMGTNSTTADNPLVPQDDSWNLLTGPSDATGGPYDGVVLQGFVRYALDGSTTVSKTVDQTGGGEVVITTTTIRSFQRFASWTSTGALWNISVEFEEDPSAEATITQLT